MRLLICVPTLDYMHTEFVKSLTALVARLKDGGVEFDTCIISGTLVYIAREKLAHKAVDEGYTHTLWLDSDMVFNDDLLDDLMFSGKDFVSGVYHARRPPHKSCIFKDIRLESIEKYDDDYPRDTFEIAGCGFGCVLIKTDIFKKVFDEYGDAFLPERGLGEDIAFCRRVRDLGLKMFCEPSVRLGHIGHITIYPDDQAEWSKEPKDA